MSNAEQGGWFSSQEPVCPGCAVVKRDLAKLKAFVELNAMDSMSSSEPKADAQLARINQLELHCTELQQGLESVLEQTEQAATVLNQAEQCLAQLQTEIKSAAAQKENMPLPTVSVLTSTETTSAEGANIAAAVEVQAQLLAVNADVAAQKKMLALQFETLSAEAAAERERVELQLQTLNAQLARESQEAHPASVVAEVKTFRSKYGELSTKLDSFERSVTNKLQGTALSSTSQLVRIENLETDLAEHRKDISNQLMCCEKRSFPVESPLPPVPPSLQSAEASLLTNIALEQRMVMVRLDELETSIRQHTRDPLQSAELSLLTDMALEQKSVMARLDEIESSTRQHTRELHAILVSLKGTR